MKPMQIQFDINNPGELAAGITPYFDRVIVTVESGDPGGEHYEFANYMRDCLAQWYDGARVAFMEPGYKSCRFCGMLTKQPGRICTQCTLDVLAKRNKKDGDE